MSTVWESTTDDEAKTREVTRLPASDGPDAVADLEPDLARKLRRKEIMRRVRLAGMQLGLASLLIVLWGVASDRFIDSFYISSPGDVWAQLSLWLETGVLAGAVVVTFQEAVLGFLIGALAGMTVGCTMGMLKRVAGVVNPFIIAANTIPKIALAPLLILWLGVGMSMKVFLAAILVFFLVFYSTYVGVRDVNVEYVNVVRLMGGSKLNVFRYVTLPSALTMVFSGLRISVPYAFLGAVVGEMLAASDGLGYLIMNSSSQFNVAGTFAALVMLLVLSILINGIVAFGDQHLLRWKKTGADG